MHLVITKITAVEGCDYHMASVGNTLTIQAEKFGQVPHYRWQGQCLRHNRVSVVSYGMLERKLEHFTRASVFRIDNQAVEFFWANRWYTVSCEFDRFGLLTRYYCNIAMPARFVGSSVYFTDLDLDVLAFPSGQTQVIDREEFRQNAARYRYPDELCLRAEEELENLLFQISQAEYPFLVSRGACPNLLDMLNLVHRSF